MANKTPASTSRRTQAGQTWQSRVAQLAAADARMERLSHWPRPSNEEMDGAGVQYSEAIHGLLQFPAPDGDALKHKLVLLLTRDDTGQPLEFTPEDREAVLADVDRIAATLPRPVNHEHAASLIQELATQAIHVQAAAEGVLHDDGNAPEAALALLPLAARLVAEIAAIAETIEAGAELVDMAAPRLAGRPH